MKTKLTFRDKPVRWLFAVALLATLAGCKRDNGSTAPAPVAQQPVAVPVVTPPPAVVVAGPDFVYYPEYEVYYDPGTRVYWYMQGDAWVSGPVVPGISVDVLLGAPSVRMDFHDSPAYHHADVARQYPRNWRPGRHP